MANLITNISGAPARLPIEPTGSAAPASGVLGTGQDGAKVGSPDQGATSLSPLGDVVSAMARGAASLPAFHVELVATIKASIAAGTYQPDPTAVAGRVALALGGSR